MDTRQSTKSERRLEKVASGRRGIRNHQVPWKEEFMGRLFRALWMDGFQSLYPRGTQFKSASRKRETGWACLGLLPPVSKHTLMNTFTKMACHRSRVPKRRSGCMEMGCMPVGTAEVVKLLTHLDTPTHTPSTHTNIHTQKIMQNKKAQRSLNLPPGLVGSLWWLIQ